MERQRKFNKNENQVINEQKIGFSTNMVIENRRVKKGG